MRFQHDCDKCKPLGEFGDADLYYCDSQLIGGPTVIARHSSDGADYQSGLVFADKIPALGEARNRAIAAGYMTPNEALKWADKNCQPEVAERLRSRAVAATLSSEVRRMRNRIERLRGALKTASGRFFDADDLRSADDCLEWAGDMEPTLVGSNVK